MVDNRDATPCVSFIGIVDFTQEARWVFLSESVADLLGYEPSELIGKPSLDLVHPDEFPQVKQIHYDTISQDKAAVLAYLRMKHKDPYKGFILCGISRTVVHDVLVGSVSFASPGAKALHNNSTAQEVTVITPTAKDFELRRWGDPSPMPPSPIPPALLTPSLGTELLNPPYPSTFSSPGSRSSQERERERAEREKDKDKDGTGNKSNRDKKAVITFDRLPTQSVRTALILDRFSVNCTIIYCSNDLLVETTEVMGRPFWDLVASKDEDNVQQWINVVKSWGVNETGQPSDGGFGFGKFHMCIRPRDSRARPPEHPAPSSRHRDRQATSSKSSHHHHRDRHHREQKPHTGSRPRIYSQSQSSSNVPTVGSTGASGSSATGSGAGAAGTREQSSTSSPATIALSTSPPSASSALPAEPPSVLVDAIFSAHSDGVMVILRRGSS